MGSLAVLSACQSSAGQQSGPPANSATAPGAARPSASAAPKASFDRSAFAGFVEKALEEWHAPGAAVVVVQDGQVRLSQGFGQRDIGRGLKVTEQTLFGIGSCTKAFTTLGLGILADKGALDWDAQVRTYLPDFHLQDPVASSLISLRDMATHRSGLPAHDIAGLVFSKTMQDVLDRLPYLPLSHPFRTTFQYGSLLYTAAGAAAGKVAGSTWEEFTRARILEPLGMSGTRLSLAAQQAVAEVALPYALEPSGSGFTARQAPFPNLDAIAPAAAISSSAADLGTWLQLHLSKGQVGSFHAISSNQLAQIHSPQMVAPVDGSYAEWPALASYGLGWYIRPYRGAIMQYHDGTIDGFTANVTLVPEAHLGVAVVSNLVGTWLPSVVVLNAVDRLLGLDPLPWSDRYKKQQAQAEAAAAKAQSAIGVSRQPARSLQSYAGDFENPGYGTLSSVTDGGALKLKINSTTLQLQPAGGDTFEFGSYAMGTRGAVNVKKVTFGTGAGGGIETVAIPFEPAVSDIVFTRQTAGPGPSPEKLAGTYLASTGIVISPGADGSLLLSVPGQPQAELTHVRQTLFGVKGVVGATVDFQQDSKGAVTGMVLNLPAGVMTAKRQ